MYIAPVFTGLEYVSFALFGVGVWQARLVSEVAGFLSVLLLALGVRRIAGREAGLIAAALAGTNYVYVMWNRAALMEASMVAFMVAAWYCYVRAQTRPLWGVLAATCALLAYFTKAAAVFFVAALGVEALLVLLRPSSADGPQSRAAARATLIGLAACGLLALAVFVLPNWTEYRFYNWQMSVTRKPSYDLRSLINRVTWFPIIHDIFTRMWFTVVVGVIAIFGAIGRWKTVVPAERLLVSWVALGAAELLLHDVGNERRFIFFIPALIALTSLVLARDRRVLPPELSQVSRMRLAWALPVSWIRPPWCCWIDRAAGVSLRAGPGVRLGAAVAAAGTVLVYIAWPTPSAAPYRSAVERFGHTAARRDRIRRSSGAVRPVGGRPATRTIVPRSSSAPSCRRVRSFMASWPTASRWRTGFGRSSSAPSSAIMRIENSATMCGIF